MNGSLKTTADWSGIVSRTYGMYWERFGVFFRIALPPALIAYLYQFVHRALISELRSSGLTPTHSWGAWLAVMVFTLIEGALYWVISGFFFAAVAANVLHDKESDESIADDFSIARKRLGPVVCVTLLIWVMFVLGRGILEFAVLTLLERLRLFRNEPLLIMAFSLPILLLAALLSRLGLAIPALIEAPALSASQAMRKSLRETENWEPFFIAFLLKTALLAYGAYWVIGLGLDWLWKHTSINPAAYTLIQGIAYVSLAATLEPPLFIAFSLLYRDSQLKHEEALPAVVG